MSRWITSTVLSLFLLQPASAADFVFKDKLTRQLVARTTQILKNYDPATGQLGKGIWICSDQNDMFPLAVAYSYKASDNTYYKDAKLLETICSCADPLIKHMNETGQWIFRKKDNSTWGMIRMPWTYTRWIRAFSLIRDDMPADARDKWTRALTLGYENISKREFAHVHNIPAHHAMGLYIAGKTLNRPEWCKQAADFLVKVAGTQFEGGYWSEHSGPLIAYNFVYVDALGTYYSLSGDKRVLPALERSAAYHYRFTYPDGNAVETVDERNPYHTGVSMGNVGFTFCSLGRTYLQSQWAKTKIEKFSADYCASMILYGQEGPVESDAALASEPLFVIQEKGNDRAATLRRGPWFVCVSAFTAKISPARWHQDRQNLVSIYHDQAGLILGGGNTKLQPAWSSFTVGDMNLLKHKPGDEEPNFMPTGPLVHVPTSAKLIREPQPGVDLVYGKERCAIHIRIKDDHTLEYVVSSAVQGELPVLAHVTLMPNLKKPLETVGGEKLTLSDKPIVLTPEQLNGAITHNGCRFRLPETASVHWPALPHNPYRKDGRAEPAEGRIEIRIPLDKQHREQTVTLEILGEKK